MFEGIFQGWPSEQVWIAATSESNWAKSLILINYIYISLFDGFLKLFNQLR
jgi:hypothetical protein